MKPGQSNLEIYRGDDFEYFFRIRTKNADGSAGPYKDLTGYTAKSQIRSSADATSIILEFTAVLADQVAYTGGVYLRATNVQTTALAIPASGVTYVWDVQLTDTTGKIKTYLAGTVAVDPDVTK